MDISSGANGSRSQEISAPNQIVCITYNDSLDDNSVVNNKLPSQLAEIAQTSSKISDDITLTTSAVESITKEQEEETEQIEVETETQEQEVTSNQGNISIDAKGADVSFSVIDGIYSISIDEGKDLEQASGGFNWYEIIKIVILLHWWSVLCGNAKKKTLPDFIRWTQKGF